MCGEASLQISCLPRFNLQRNLEAELHPSAKEQQNLREGGAQQQKLVLSKIRFYLAKKFTTKKIFFCTRAEDHLRQGLVDTVDSSVCFILR